MIGMSLSYKDFLSGNNPAQKLDTLLLQLWDHGVRGIELRGISPSVNPIEALRIANILWDYGFQVTVHSQAKSDPDYTGDKTYPPRPAYRP